MKPLGMAFVIFAKWRDRERSREERLLLHARDIPGSVPWPHCIRRKTSSTIGWSINSAASPRPKET
jgi:hypothetical protein